MDRPRRLAAAGRDTVSVSVRTRERRVTVTLNGALTGATAARLTTAVGRAVADRPHCARELVVDLRQVERLDAAGAAALASAITGPSAAAMHAVVVPSAQVATVLRAGGINLPMARPDDTPVATGGDQRAQRVAATTALGRLQRRIDARQMTGADWVELAQLLTRDTGVPVWAPPRLLDRWTRRLVSEIAAGGTDAHRAALRLLVDGAATHEPAARAIARADDDTRRRGDSCMPSPCP